MSGTVLATRRGASRGTRGTWRTWSRTVRCTPAHLVRPVTEDDLVEAVGVAGELGLPVRAAGSGHSFNPVACTDGVLLDLSHYSGTERIDPDAMTVTVRAGTPLSVVCTVLDRVGLALANMGTLAEQTIAGAVSTGNHGSGIAHPPFAGQIRELRLVTAAGTVRRLAPDSDPDLFRCARTALGTLGVISTVTLRCVPQFNLRAVRRLEPLDGLLDRVEDWAASADHVTFSWSPWRDEAATRSLQVTDAPRTPRASLRRYASTLQEVRSGLIGLAGRVRPRAVPRLTGGRPGAAPGRDDAVPVPGQGAAEAGADEYVDVSHRVFTFPQPVRFLAMEHALPLENVAPALRALRGALRRFALYSPYPMLVGVGAGDDAPLSPAYGRRTGYVNLTVPRAASHVETLRVAEPILREFDARPHWGKAHTATAEILAPRYPEWAEFQRVRAQLDPASLFTSDYVVRVLGPVQARDRRPDRTRA